MISERKYREDTEEVKQGEGDGVGERGRERVRGTRKALNCIQTKLIHVHLVEVNNG